MSPKPEKSPLDPKSIAKVASGQKLVIYAVVLQLITIITAAQSSVGNIVVLLMIAALILALVGMFRIAAGLGYSGAVTVLLTVSLIIPLIAVITLVFLNWHATKTLRRAGYSVGLLGASR